MACTKSHRYDARFAGLPDDQGGDGRHRCAGCAYDQGYEDGLNRSLMFNLDLNNIPDSQAGCVRHKSPQVAYALGYFDGISESYK